MRILLACSIAALLLSSPIHGEDRLRVEELMPLLADLASRSGYGNGHAEVGAFLVRDSDGMIRCELWNQSAEFQKTSHRGVIPPGTIAIAHTHPRCCRDLSAHDRKEAERIGIPIIAVSMGTVHLVEGDGTGDRPLRGISWSRHRSPGQTCSRVSTATLALMADPLSR